jgi:hypothetical protein
MCIVGKGIVLHSSRYNVIRRQKSFTHCHLVKILTLGSTLAFYSFPIWKGEIFEIEFYTFEYAPFGIHFHFISSFTLSLRVMLLSMFFKLNELKKHVPCCNVTHRLDPITVQQFFLNCSFLKMCQFKK